MVADADRSSFPSDEDHERIACLVDQGFPPSLAWSVLSARSRECLPLTIWLLDDSSSMTISDGRRLLETPSPDEVGVARCTRWEELKEAVSYHAQLAALLEAPTRFVPLNHGANTTTMSIGEHGSDRIPDDLEDLEDHIASLSPGGFTPLARRLREVYRSVRDLTRKVVLVVATDGRPTDDRGYSTPEADRDFEAALRRVQSRAWVVIRLCTNEDSVLEYYQRLDEELELDLEVLDDYLDEAKEVHEHNPWLNYGLPLHRCREMGMGCLPEHRWLDWLDERPLRRDEACRVLITLGLLPSGDEPRPQEDSGYDEPEAWAGICGVVEREQKQQQRKLQTRNDSRGVPWNPIRRRPTPWVDVSRLRRVGQKHSWVQAVDPARVLLFMAVLLSFFVWCFRDVLPDHERAWWPACLFGVLEKTTPSQQEALL